MFSRGETMGACFSVSRGVLEKDDGQDKVPGSRSFALTLIDLGSWAWGARSIKSLCQRASQACAANRFDPHTYQRLPQQRLQVVRLALGSHHSTALTAAGVLFSFGMGYVECLTDVFVVRQVQSE